MSHANGISLLLEVRGPSLQKLLNMKGIFLEHRIVLVINLSLKISTRV